MIRRGLLLALGCLLLLLSGCVSTMLRERENPDVVLPEIRPGPQAPVGDSQKDWESTVVLYLPDADASRLQAVSRTIIIHSGQTKQEACVEALLDAINASDFSPGGQPLALAQVSNAVESTGELVTVNLQSSARRLSERAFFALRVAITNTLTELKEANYVNVLVNGSDTGLDLAETLPTGVMARYPSGDISAFWGQIEMQRAASNAELQKAAALYFVSDNGKALLGEVRNISFPQRNAAAYAKRLLDELATTTTIEGARVLVPVSDWFECDPVHVREPETSTNYIELYFLSYIDEYLRPPETTRGMMFSSIAYTLTNFIPQLEGVMFYVGGQLVTQVMLMDGNEWVDAGGMMRREHLTSLASDICTVYFPLIDGSGVHPVKRPIAQRFRSQPRALLRELMNAPVDMALTNAFPAGISDADILGVMIQGDSALVNLSDAFALACKNMSPAMERCMVYSMVNTLTEIDAVKRVRFYVNGEQKPLAGNIFMSGEFLRHPGLIR